MRGRVRVRVYEILEAGRAGDWLSTFVDSVIIALIVLNVVAFAAGTVPHIHAAFGFELELFNIISVMIFTVEYLLRLWCSVETPHLRHHTPLKARLIFASRTLQIIDLLAIAPFYLSWLVGVDLRVLRVLRLLRFLKIARYSPALMTLWQVVRNESRALFGALIIMCSLLLFASTALYLIEHKVQPEAFGSIPAASWWALSTLTTIGYGDVVPVTPLGKALGGLFMLFGLAMFALPIGIMATGFSREINRHEFVVTWGMVAKVPLFAHLSASEIAEVMALLHASTFNEGSIIFRQGDPAQSLNFILSGDVRIETVNGPVRLGSGDYFGEMALIERRPRQADAIALTKCNLLVLDVDDFYYLLRHNQQIATHINETISQRRAEFESSAKS